MAGTPKKALAASKDVGHLFDTNEVDSLLIHLNPLRIIRSVAEEHGISNKPEVEWIARFERDLARIYGDKPTATKLHTNMRYIWIQDPDMIREYQTWLPRAYDLMLDTGHYIQVNEVASTYPVYASAWRPPKVAKTGKYKKLADYTKSELVAYQAFKALEKPSDDAAGEGRVPISAVLSHMSQWWRRDLAATGSEYTEIYEPGSSEYMAALEHRWYDMVQEDGADISMRGEIDLALDMFRPAVQMMYGALVADEQQPTIEKPSLRTPDVFDTSLFDFAASENKHELPELAKDYDYRHGTADDSQEMHMDDMDLDVFVKEESPTNENHPFSFDVPVGPAVEILPKTTEPEHGEATNLNEADVDEEKDANTNRGVVSPTDNSMDSTMETSTGSADPGHGEAASAPQPEILTYKIGMKAVAQFDNDEWFRAMQ